MTAAVPIARIRVRARLFAVQRELAGRREIPLDLPAGATVEDGWAALVEAVPALAPGWPSVRFARNGDYADPGDSLADGDELAVIPPVSGGAADGPAGTGEHRRILELRTDPFSNEILGELADALATPGDGAVVGFLGRTRVTPGTPAPGQEAEAARHAGRSVESLDYEAHESMALRMLEQIADEIAERFDVHRLAIVHRLGTVPLGEVSVAIVAVAPHRDAAFDAARYGIDETKGRVPIWKAEQFQDGRVWIGEPARSGPTAPLSARPADGTSARPAGTPPARPAGALRPDRPLVGPAGRHAAGRRLGTVTAGSLGPLDRLVGLAETLGAAWSGRARASTTLGQERALLRLIGVGGVDRRGRPLATEVVEGFLDQGSARLGGGILLPFAMALLEYDVTPQDLALDVADGTIDLVLEAQLLRDPDRRAAAEREAQRLVDSALERIDANRTARRELLDILGEPPRPWFGLSVLGPTLEDAAREVRQLVAAGADILRITVPANRELATAAGEDAPARAATRLSPASATRAAAAATSVRVARDVTPAGSQRGVAALRALLDELAVERGRYIRLATVAPPLAAPEAAAVAAFERVDLVQADPMAEIVGVGVDPDRAIADHAFGHRLLARAGVPILIGPGPLVVGPDLATGRPSDPATRAGRALALQSLSVAVARASGIADESIVVGAMPAWLSDEREPTVLAIGQVVLRRAIFARHPLAFDEPVESVASEGWPFMFAAAAPGSEPIALVLRRAEVPRVGQVGEATRAAVRVAREVDLALGERTLRDGALDHARRSVESAVALLERIADEGWPAVLGLVPAVAGHLGGDAVAERTEDFDPLASRAGLRASA